MTSSTWLVSNCRGSNEMHRRRKVLNFEGMGGGGGGGGQGSEWGVGARGSKLCAGC